MGGDETLETNFSLKTGEVYDPGRQEAIDAWARLLRESRVDTFNHRVAEAGPADLTGANLRMTDLRDADLDGASLRGAYLRAADLRGQDLSRCDLEGASLAGAKVSGVRFPDNIGADEIQMSLAHGTRLRVRKT